MIHLFRTRMAATAPTVELPPGTTHLATTIGGAPVAVHPHTYRGESGTAWVCFGCDDRGADGGSWLDSFGYPGPRRSVISTANDHAANCHFTTKPA